MRVMVVGGEEEGCSSSWRIAVPTLPPGYDPGGKSVNKGGQTLIVG